MKPLALLIAIAAWLPPCLVAQEVAVGEGTVEGIPVIHKPIAGNEVIAVRLYVKGGSGALSPDLAGIERFVGDVATHGTERFSKEEFAARAAATGTEIGGEALYDFSVVTLQSVAEYWDEAWELFTQAVLHPTFPPEEVELVREQILNQLRGREDDPDQYLALLANDLLYAGHPYANDPLGTVEAIEKVSRDDLIAWHGSRLTKENLLFVVVGNVPWSDLETKIADAFGDIAPGGEGAEELAPNVPGPADLTTVERDLPTNYVRGHFAAPSPGESDYAALRVGIDILSDRLFEEIRTKRNLTYAVFSGLSQRQANYGLLYVTAVEPDTTLKVMFSEVERLKREPITEERLGESVTVFVTQYWMGQETNMGQAAALGTFELVGGGWERADEFVDRVRAVRPEDIQRVAERYLRDIHFAVLGDPNEIDRDLFTSL